MKDSTTITENRIRTSTRAAGCPTDCGALQTVPAVLGRVDRAIEVASAIVNNDWEDQQ